jgi:serine phosphatase RsbU (regulator of sigma subunit)
MERLRNAVLRAADADPATLARRVLDLIHDFERGAHASDDKTVVVLRRAWGSLA